MTQVMASWDDEDFEPVKVAAGATTTIDHWDGEDEDDDDLKDNWDDDEEDKDKEGVPKSQPKKKKTLAEKIAERDERKRQEAIAKMLQEPDKELSPEEEMEEKLRAQRLQEEADLEIAKDAFGIVDLPTPDVKTIDNFEPSSKEEFLQLSNMIVEKLSKLEHRTDYSFFLETLLRDCCAGREGDEIKKISNTLNALVQEKQKLNKVAKGKKKPPVNKTLKSGKGMNDELGYNDGYYDEFDDFM